jgi:hypothetical protein
MNWFSLLGSYRKKWAVRLRRIGLEYHNEPHRTISGIFPLQQDVKLAHAHLLRSRHVMRENACHRHVVSLRRCQWISCEGGKLGRSHLRATLWCVWRCLHGCQQCQKVGETFYGPKHGHRRSAALWSTENCCNWAWQAKSRRAHQRSPKDNIQRNCSAAWSGAPCGPGDGGNFGMSEKMLPLGSPFAYGYIWTQNGWELISHPLYSRDLAPQTTTC